MVQQFDGVVKALLDPDGVVTEGVLARIAEAEHLLTERQFELALSVLNRWMRPILGWLLTLLMHSMRPIAMAKWLPSWLTVLLQACSRRTCNIAFGRCANLGGFPKPETGSGIIVVFKPHRRRCFVGLCFSGSLKLAKTHSIEGAYGRPCPSHSS